MVSDQIKGNITRKAGRSLTSLSLFIALVFFSTSCNQFLDEVPDNRVNLDNLEKAAQLLTNAYSVASYNFTDWMSDNAQYIRGVSLRTIHEQAFKWEDILNDPDEFDTPILFWNETYNAIAHANEVLAVLNDLPTTTDEELKRRDAVEAEALLTRAYGHFMLVNIFAKHYDEETAATDLGVPYVTTPETVFIKQYERNTVQQVYDKVEADMLRGIELLDDSFYANSGKYHFTKNAALAFASRFYLFKWDFRECINYSDELLGDNPESFVRDLTSEEFLNASSSVDAYPQLYSSPEQASNLMLMRKISIYHYTSYGHGPDNQFYPDLFDTSPFQFSTDYRENPAFVKGENGLFPARYQSLFQRSSLNSNVGTPYHIYIPFRGEEVLLNRIEANIYRNRISSALADLQVLTDKRFDDDAQISMPLLRAFFGNPNVSDQAILLEYTLLERRKEFLCQGMRWFDLKRYQLPVTHIDIDGTEMELDADDLRKVIQIPITAVEVGGLEPNPR